MTDLPQDEGAKLDPSLRRWMQARAEAERCTVILHLRATVPVEEARSALSEAGAEIRSAGPGVVTAVVTTTVILRLVSLSIVRAIEAPKELRMRGPTMPKGTL